MNFGLNLSFYTKNSKSARVRKAILEKYPTLQDWSKEEQTHQVERVRLLKFFCVSGNCSLKSIANVDCEQFIKDHRVCIELVYDQKEPQLLCQQVQYRKLPK